MWLKSTSLAVWWLAAAWLWVEAMARSWNKLALGVKETVQNIAGEAVNLLEMTGVHIGELAPLSDLGLQDLIEKLAGNTGLFELGFAGALWLAAWWVGGKATDWLSKLTWHETTWWDRTIAKTWAGIAWVTMVLWVDEIAFLTAGATAAYIIPKKLAQNILSERNAHIVWMAFAAWWVAVEGMWINEWIAIPAMVTIWGLSALWDSWAESRETRRSNRAAKKSRRTA